MKTTFSRAYCVLTLTACSVLFALIVTACSRRTEKEAWLNGNGQYRVVSEMVGGRPERIVLTTNDVSFFAGSSNVVVWFGTNTSITFVLRPSMRLKSWLLTTPEVKICDQNGDGVPEFRQWTGDSGLEYLYQGGWYRSDPNESNIVIEVNGKRLTLFHKNGFWEAVTNQVKREAGPGLQDNSK